MTPGAKGYDAEDRAARRQRVEDLAFLLLAFSIIVLPACLVSGCPGEPKVLDGTSEPVRIDVNRAPWYEWILLDGIGEVRARRIVEFRDRSGPFRSIEQLEQVPGMPEGWTEAARPHLVIREDR